MFYIKTTITNKDKIIISSNSPSIQPKEDQIKGAMGNLKTDEQEASDSGLKSLKRGYRKIYCAG